MRLIIFILVGFTPGIAIAEFDYPDLVTLQNTSENSALDITCEKSDERNIHCNFAQYSVTKKTKASDLLKELDNARKELTQHPPKMRQCDEMRKIAQAIKSGSSQNTDVKDPIKFREQYEKLPETEKSDMAEMLEAYADYSCKPSIRTAEEMAKIQHAQKLRTCKVWSNTYAQDFSLDTNTGNWINKGKPSGPCGTIVFSYFERDDKEGILWNYTTRKIVTNPNGSIGMAKCSLIDEGKYEYTWRLKKNFVGCDYIEFGF